THTLVCGPGGLTRIWDLESDAISLGKSIAAGVPIGAYGMTEELASVFAHPDTTDMGHSPHGVATGGTLFANALSAAAARAALGEVLTDDAYAHTAKLGTRLADGMEAAGQDVDRPGTIHRFFRGGGCTVSPRACPATPRRPAPWRIARSCT